MKTVRRVLALMMTLACACSMMIAPAAASEVDVMHDHSPNARYTSVPTSEYDLGDGDYYGYFDIEQFTNTNYYFKANDEGDLYYSISGSSDAGEDCTVETWCKTCGSKYSSYTFDPNGGPYHRVVHVNNTHRTHNFYFKIIAYRGGEYFSDNDFSGSICVSWS